MVTEAPSDHHGRVVVFYRKVEHFAIEDLHLHGMNVIRFHMVTGRQQWHVVGCYISLSSVSTIEDISADIRDQPYRANILVSGNLNANLAKPEVTPQGEAIVYKIATEGLLYMGLHFLPQRKPWLQDRCTYSIRNYG